MWIVTRLFFACFAWGLCGFDNYPVDCTHSEGKLYLTLQLGDLVHDAEVEYTPEKKLVVTAGTEAEKVTFTVEQCIAYLVIKSKHAHRDGSEGDMVISSYTHSATATYPYILPACIADTGALYTKEQDRITLILLPVEELAM